MFTIIFSTYNARVFQFFHPTLLGRQILLAMANLLLWMAFSRYVEGLNFNMNAFSATVPSALLRLSAFITGAVFVFMGFTMFGMSYFGNKV